MLTRDLFAAANLLFSLETDAFLRIAVSWEFTCPYISSVVWGW